MAEPKYKTLLKWYNSGYWWIEDKFANALDGHAVGLNSILVDADYNSKYITTRFPRVSGDNPWEQIYSLIQSSP